MTEKGIGRETESVQNSKECSFPFDFKDNTVENESVEDNSSKTVFEDLDLDILENKLKQMSEDSEELVEIFTEGEDVAKRVCSSIKNFG